MIKAKKTLKGRISQGDILKNVEHIENVINDGDFLKISSIVFPLSIVLTQDCDLEQDYKFRWSHKPTPNEDKYLLTVILAPIYNAEHVYAGDHLSDIGLSMTSINRKRTPGINLKNNETPRYHYLEFPSEFRIPPSVIDFKHYYSVNVENLKVFKKNNFICQVSELFREYISQRFASYLSRIGLP